MAQQIRIPIHTLAGGVGRQPITKRLPTEAEELDNVFLTIEKSIEKRNGFEYFSGKEGIYDEDSNLAPEAIVFSTLDLTIGGSTGTEVYIPEDEDEFFFEWLELDKDNIFLLGVNLSLSPEQPDLDVVTQQHVAGSTQDYVWSNGPKSYDTSRYSENFKKKFITVWKLESENLSLQTIDYSSVTDEVINYLQYGYTTNTSQTLVKAKSFGTSVVMLNTLVPAGYKKLYKTTLSGSPVINRTFTNTAIKIKAKSSDTGAFAGYEQSVTTSADYKTFKQFSNDSSYVGKAQQGDIIYIYDSTGSTLVGYFTVKNTKSKFQLISFDLDDILDESSTIPKDINSSTTYTIKILDTQKERGSEEIRYRTAAFPKSLGYQTIPITFDTKLIDLNGVNMTVRAARYNPEGADWQVEPGCGWSSGELTHNNALSTFWFLNKGKTNRVDLSIPVNDAKITIGDLRDKIEGSGGDVTVVINKDTNGLTLVDSGTEEPVPVLDTYITVESSGCQKFDDTANKLGLTNYNGKNLNPIGLGQIRGIFGGSLEHLGWIGAGPGGLNEYVTDPPWDLWPNRDATGNFDASEFVKCMNQGIAVSSGIEPWGTVTGSDFSIPKGSTNPSFSGGKNPAADLLFFCALYAHHQNSETNAIYNPDQNTVWQNPINISGDILIEGSYHSSPDGFSNTNTAGKNFKGTWNYTYPKDNRTAFKGRETEVVPPVEVSLEWGIGQLNFNIIEEGHGYSTGRTDTDGNPSSDTPVKVSFTNLPKLVFPNPGTSDAVFATHDGTNPDNNQTYTFEHTGNTRVKGKNCLFIPQTRLNEIGITTQEQINNFTILQSQGDRSWNNDVLEKDLFEINLTNSNGTIPGLDRQPNIASAFSAVVGGGKYSVLQPSDDLVTLQQFIEISTLAEAKDLSSFVSTLELDNDDNSVRVKNVKSDAGVDLVSSILPYTTDSGFFFTTESSSLYTDLLMPLSFTDTLKIKYNRKKHQPAADNVVLSGSTNLDIGQSVESFSLLPIPPVNDDDFLDLNGAEESLEYLYGEDTVGDFYGRGKVFFTRETYLTKTSGFFRTVSFEDKGSPFYEQVRAEAPYGMFDESVMPVLFDFATADNTWRFFKAPFKHRLAGTLASNPGPQAFVASDNQRVRKPIKDLTFWRDRMWMCVEDNVFSSKIGDYYDLWLADPDNIVDTDPIDVRTGRGNLITINNLVPFEDYMFISTMNDMQFELLGSENQITPTTAELQATSFYSTDPILEPQLLGSQIYFFAPQKIYLYYGSTSASVNNATEVTFQAEKYLPTSFIDIASSAIKEMIALVDKVKQNHIYFYTSRFSGDRVIQNSLHKWITSSTDKVKKVRFIDNDMYSIVMRPFKKPNGNTSSQYFIDKLSLITEDEKYPRIDRRVSMVPEENPGAIETIGVDTCGTITACTMINNSTLGYNPGDILTFEDPITENNTPGTGLELKVTGVDSTGKITGFAVSNGGSNYLLPSDIGETNSDKVNRLVADPANAVSGNFVRATALLATAADIDSGAAVPFGGRTAAPSEAEAGGIIPLTTNGFAAFYITAVNNKVPQGYGVGSVVEKSTGGGTGGKFKVTAVQTLNYGGGNFQVNGMPTALEVIETGRGFAKGDTGLTTTVPGGYFASMGLAGIPYVVNSIKTLNKHNTVYDSGGNQTTFTLPVQNDEINKAILGKNQTDAGQELTIVSTTSLAGKKTTVVVSGDQRVDNVISSEDLGQVDGTVTSEEDYFKASDLFILSSDDYGKLFGFSETDTEKRENWFGTSFDMNATLSELVFRDQSNNALDGVLNIKNVSLKFYKTGKFNLKVERKPYNNNTDTVITDPFYKERINSESFDSTKLNVQENGEFMAKIMSFAPNAVISITSSYHEPVNIANMEFRGIFTPRMSSIRN